MTRLLLFSDLQLDRPQPAGVDLRETLTRICALATRLDVDALCCAGNLYDRAGASEETAEFLRAELAELAPLPVFLAPGCSDWWDQSSFYTWAGFWSPNVTIFKQPLLVRRDVGGLALWGAAHVQAEHVTGFLDGFEVTDPGVHIALFHGSELSVARTPFTAPFTAAQVRRSGLNHALVGHVPVAHATPDFTYPGLTVAPPDADPRSGGVVLVTIDEDGLVLRQWHDVSGGESGDESNTAARRFFDVQQVPSQASLFTGSLSAAGPSWRPSVPIQRAPGQPSDVEWLESIVTGPTGPVEDPRPRLDQIAATRTIRGQFVRNVRRAGLAEDELSVLRVGFLALDGRLGAAEPGGG